MSIAALGVVIFISFWIMISFSLSIEYGGTYGLVFTSFLAIVIFPFFIGLIKRAWVSKHIDYAILADGIGFKWGKGEHHQLFVPYYRIHSYHLNKGSQYSTIYFVCADGDIPKHFPSLSEDGEPAIAFVDVPKGPDVIEILNQNYDSTKKLEPNLDLPLTRNFDPKYLQLFNKIAAVAMLLFCGYVFVSIIDSSIYGSDIDDKVVKSFRKSFHGSTMLILITEKGHEIRMNGFRFKKPDEVTITFSPLFGRLNSLVVRGKDVSEKLYTGYNGFAVLMKFFQIIGLFIVSCFILMRDGLVDVEEMPVVYSPAVVLFVLANLVVTF